MMLLWSAGVLYPPAFAVTLNTTNPTGGAVSVATIFTSQTNSLNLSVGLGAFPFVAANRRAVGSCAAGTEWRYARLGAPLASACNCPANLQCAGNTACNIVPAAGEIWQVVVVSQSLCATVVPTPPPLNATNVTKTINTTNATVAVPAVSPSVSTSSPDLALGLGLGLGLGVPAILGGIIAFQLSRRRPLPEPAKQSSIVWVLSGSA
jgi:hypothetical protein